MADTGGQWYPLPDPNTEQIPVTPVPPSIKEMQELWQRSQDELFRELHGIQNLAESIKLLTYELEDESALLIAASLLGKARRVHKELTNRRSQTYGNHGSRSNL